MSTPMQKTNAQWPEWLGIAAVVAIVVVVSRLDRLWEGLGLVVVLLVLIGLWRFLKRPRRMP